VRRLIFTVIVGALWLTAAGASAAGPPAVNETVSFTQAISEVGTDCANGNPSLIEGQVSGVMHTLVLSDGSVHVSGSVKGTSTNDDLPPDGVIDATNTFVSTFNDIVFASGKEVHTFTLNGEGTATATGSGFRFNVIIHIVLDAEGNPHASVFRLVCR
jgi:hypothetical protein